MMYIWSADFFLSIKYYTIQKYCNWAVINNMKFTLENLAATGTPNIPTVNDHHTEIFSEINYTW